MSHLIPSQGRPSIPVFRPSRPVTPFPSANSDLAAMDATLLPEHRLWHPNLSQAGFFEGLTHVLPLLLHFQVINLEYAWNTFSIMQIQYLMRPNRRYIIQFEECTYVCIIQCFQSCHRQAPQEGSNKFRWQPRVLFILDILFLPQPSVRSCQVWNTKV